MYKYKKPELRYWSRFSTYNKIMFIGVRMPIRSKAVHAGVVLWFSGCCVLNNLLLTDFYDEEWNDLTEVPTLKPDHGPTPTILEAGEWKKIYQKRIVLAKKKQKRICYTFI